MSRRRSAGGGYDLDHSGYDTLDDLLTERTQSQSFYGVDPSRRTVWLMRADGTAWGAVTYSRGGDRWFLDGGLSCEDDLGTEPGADLDVACVPTSWGYTDAPIAETLTQLAGSRAYVHDRSAKQLYYAGREGTFSSTTTYSRPQQKWYPEQLADCPRTTPSETPLADSSLSDPLDCALEDIVIATIANPEATGAGRNRRSRQSTGG